MYRRSTRRRGGPTRSAEFRAAYRKAATATPAVEAGEPTGEQDGSVVVPLSLHTRVFGRVGGELRLPVHHEQVTWGPLLAFPGLRRARRSRGAAARHDAARCFRATARCSRAGPSTARSSPLEAIARLDRRDAGAPGDRRGARALYARGFPRTPVGQNGLERAFEHRARGPAGRGAAGRRPRARARRAREPAPPVRTTIDTPPPGGRRHRAGRPLRRHRRARPAQRRDPGAGGIAFSAPQPPGSTFKIVTTTAALEAGKVKPRDEFPVATAATIDGVELENANGEFCGGTLPRAASPTRATRSSRRWAWRWAPDALVADGRALRLERRADACPARSRARCRRRPRSSRRSRSARPRSARSGCWPPRSRWPRWPRPSRRAACATCRRCRRGDCDAQPMRVYAGGSPARSSADDRRGRLRHRHAAAIPGIKVAGKTGTAELEDTARPRDGETRARTRPTPTPGSRPTRRRASRDRGRGDAVRAGAGGATAAPAAKTWCSQAGAR